ncbi:MAG: hypothetical protein RIR18_467 [Pseudomonadota bacterium]
MIIKTLIIEDLEKVASAIEQQLRQTRYQGVVHKTKDVSQALVRINTATDEPYDLILCDYNLGESTNGQQFLEYLRSEHLIPRKTAFIMLTAESSYAKVASAVELIPDGYLLKPFTLEGLTQRIDFALEKREALKAALLLVDQPAPDYAGAIKACNAVILSATRFSLEALKLKAECLLLLGQWGEAASVYDKIIAWRPTPWAEVGLARTLRLMGHPQLAEKKLLKSIEDFPQFVAAYDELAALAEEKGDNLLAQETLEKAHLIVPSNRRTRNLGLLSLQNKNPEKAAKYLRIVTERDRYGLKRSTEDFFLLAKALRDLTRYDEAIAVIDSLKFHFPETEPLTVRKMAAEAVILFSGGRTFDAKRKLKEALKLRQDQTEARTQLELGEACYLCGVKDEAEKIFLHIAENWQESPKIIDDLKSTVQRVGMGAYGVDLVQNSIKELIQLNNLAAGQIRQGKYENAVNNLQQIANRLLNHATVQANYVQALLMWVEHNSPKNLRSLPEISKPKQLLALAKAHLRQLASIDGKHRHLGALLRLYAKLTGDTAPIADVENFASLQEPASMEKGA